MKKRELEQLIQKIVDEKVEEGAIKSPVKVMLERPPREELGDFSTNVAMLLTKSERKPPRQIAELLVPSIEALGCVEDVRVEGPGFINIYLNKDCWYETLKEILQKRGSYGDCPHVGGGKKVQVEFVSANPTGPLHIGHGRGAAVGDALSRILEAAGYQITREYYINDVGKQMTILGHSLYIRYLELLGKDVTLPEDHYQGDYIKDIAEEFLKRQGKKYAEVPFEECSQLFIEFAKDSILSGIKKDLEDFGVHFDVWFSEKTLFQENLVETTIEELKARGVIYEKDGALWFKTTEFGDDKDRVLVKQDGSTTYFASDIAYHRDKLRRGFHTIVDIWGADHHGYAPRIRALFSALGEDPERLKIILIQLVSLKRGGKPVAMSTRKAEFVTLREVIDEVGKDAARFIFLTRKADAHLEFDLELARRQAPENPVYYVQYCHARIMSILEFAKEKGLDIPDAPQTELLRRLDLKEELNIIKHLSRLEEVVESAATSFEPHRVTFYLRELAALFHPYYNTHRVVSEDTELSLARLTLCRATAEVVRKGLRLLGVDAPSRM